MIDNTTYGRAASDGGVAHPWNRFSDCLAGCSGALANGEGFRLGIVNHSQTTRRVRVELSSEESVFFSQKLYVAGAEDSAPTTTYTTVERPAVPPQATILVRAAVGDRDWTVGGTEIDCRAGESPLLRLDIEAESGALSIRERAACSDTLPGPRE